CLVEPRRPEPLRLHRAGGPGKVHHATFAPLRIASPRGTTAKSLAHRFKRGGGHGAPPQGGHARSGSAAEVPDPRSKRRNPGRPRKDANAFLCQRGPSLANSFP